MSIDDPNDLIGKRESATLEFKAQEILKAPAKIAREVVGFLNASGGHVWIGVQENGGVAVPPLQAIPNADKEKDALRDHLMATIEPPISDEVALDVVSTREGACLLKVSVKKGARRPYAQLERGRHFWIRVDSRLRDMSREEIFEGARALQRNEDSLTPLINGLRDEQRKEEEDQKKPGRLWLRLVPSIPLNVDLENEATRSQFRSWLMDARTTGNRPAGSSFVRGLGEPRHRHDRIEAGDPAIPWTTEITTKGRVTFTLKSGALYGIEHPDARNVVPIRLLELPVSVFRLAARVLEKYGSNGNRDGQIIVGFFISAFRGAHLRPGSSNFPLPPWKKIATFDEPVLSVDPEQLKFDADQLLSNPDRCALRLVRLVYDAFDLGSEDIPPEFDQKQGVLLLT